MKKRMILAVIGLAVIGLAFPVMNLIIPVPPTKLASFTSTDESVAAAARILSAKCAVCHSQSPRLPFYASFPVAKQLMEYDVKMGERNVDFVREFMPDTPMPVSEATLAKIEYILADGSMPPARYLIMHWKDFLSASEKETLLKWVHAARAKDHAVPGLSETMQQAALKPLPEKLDTNPAKVALGDKLFHDKRLSKDDSIACASCHDLKKGGTDQEPFSKGVGGQLGGINAPTVFNAALQFIQFWDGRAANLAAQADGPVNNPVEMASNWGEATGKLSQDAEFTQAFNAVYPDGYKKENFVDAIAEFEKTLLTPSAYDKYLRGDQGALTADQKAGLALFKEMKCATCHCGPALGGRSFEYMGLKADYFKDRGEVKDADYGRYSVTKNEADRFRLKVPVLRNIKLTFPYFHDSTTSDLAEAVNTMAKYQVGKPLTEAQTAQMVKFLESLTGEYNGQPL